jgi:ArsR family transcriptional regulator
MKAREAIRSLSALASEPRLAVYRLLVRRGPAGFTPSELAERLQLPAPTLSFHLKGLMQAGLVTSRRDGRNLFYSPHLGHMHGLVGFLTENCCSLADQPDCAQACEPVTTQNPRRKRA